MQADSFSLRSGSLNLTLVKKYILTNQLCLFARAAETPVHSEGDQPWDFFGGNDAEAETPVLWPPHAKS